MIVALEVRLEVVAVDTAHSYASGHLVEARREIGCADRESVEITCGIAEHARAPGVRQAAPRQADHASPGIVPIAGNRRQLSRAADDERHERRLQLQADERLMQVVQALELAADQRLEQIVVRLLQVVEISAKRVAG